MSGEITEDMKYMIRRKFYIPDNERNRDYRRFERLPADVVLSCDFEEQTEDDEDTIQWSEPEFK